MIKPLNGTDVGLTPLQAHSTAAALGWHLNRGMPEGSPPNAIGDYSRGKEHALLCADHGHYSLIVYAIG